ncbi:MAG: outer membrane protein assembly factor BamA [Deltaproteobacteria bacterium]
MEESGGTLTVTFTVEEGPLVHLEKILVTGNQSFEQQTLLAFFERENQSLLGHGEIPLVKADVESAVSRIRDFYLSKGFFKVFVGEPQFTFNPDKTEATVSVHVEEGVRFVIHDVVVRGDTVEGLKGVVQTLRNEWLERPYFSRRAVDLRNRLTDFFGNQGYPRAVVHVKEEQGESPGQVVLVAAVEKGPLVTISRIVIKGNEKIRNNFIRNRLILKPGERFDLRKQRESFTRLYRTGLFSRVSLNLQEVKESNGWPLIVEVKEVPAKEVYFESGWGSYERLRMGAGFRDRNLFGTGRILDLKGNGSLKARGIEVSVSDPWFLNTSVAASLPVRYSRREEPSFTREAKEASIQFSKEVPAHHLSLAAQYGFRVTKLSGVSAEEINPQDDYNLASAKIQSTYDTRDDPLFPSSGQRCFVSAERAGTFLGGEISFFRFTGGARFFHSLTKNTILALRYSTGLIIPGSNAITVPVAERFFNGGENTVRSFRQSELGPQDQSGDPAGGLAFNVFSVELRHRLKQNLVGSFFLDLGNISPNRTRHERRLPPYESRSDILSDTFSGYFKDMRPGVGVGLQYLLPVGPVRADVAFNPDRDAERGEESVVFHFSVGMAF